MLLRHALMPILVTGLCLAPRAAHAQAPDSITFHRGQWGTEFTMSGGFAAAGLLHFTSPTHALLIDFGANYDHNTSSVNTHSGTLDAVAATVRLGTRAYRFFDRRLYRFTTLGITGNYAWQRNTQDSLRSGSQGFGGGVFADFGASWLITPHLALGATCGATLTYWYARGGGGHSTRISLAVGHVSLAGQLYF